jgi:hypothetical protein
MRLLMTLLSRFHRLRTLGERVASIGFVTASLTKMSVWLAVL